MIRIRVGSGKNEKVDYAKDPVSGDKLPDREIMASPHIYPPPQTGGPMMGGLGGVENPVAVPGGRWVFGLLERLEVYEAGEIFKTSILHLEFDCVDVTWFQACAPDFDPFYPEGVDDQANPSYHYL